MRRRDTTGSQTNCCGDFSSVTSSQRLFRYRFPFHAFEIAPCLSGTVSFACRVTRLLYAAPCPYHIYLRATLLPPSWRNSRSLFARTTPSRGVLIFACNFHIRIQEKREQRWHGGWRGNESCRNNYRRYDSSVDGKGGKAT